VEVVAGVDLGGTAINYTLVNPDEQFLIEGLCEYPARSKEGPDVCLPQIVDGLKIAVENAGLTVADVVAAGLDTPGPASSAGVLSAEGSTNFVHRDWCGYDIRGRLAAHGAPAPCARSLPAAPPAGVRVDAFATIPVHGCRHPVPGATAAAWCPYEDRRRRKWVAR